MPHGKILQTARRRNLPGLKDPGAEFEIVRIDFRSDEQRKPDDLAPAGFRSPDGRFNQESFSDSRLQRA